MIYDLMFKSTTKSTWDEFALSSGLTVDQDGSVYPAENVLIDEIGPIVTEPAVYDEDGDLVTPAVIDESWHVNVRLIGESFDIPALAAGDEDTEWIDPALVTVPNRIWAGGMNYWVPPSP